jgi:ABC-type uncharacterized transport system ATPase subunit
MICNGRQVIAGSVESIRAQTGERTLWIKTADGQIPYDFEQQHFAGVLGATRSVGNLKLTVSKSFEPGPLMRYLTEQTEIINWELKQPTLHDVFVANVHADLPR